MRRRGFGGAVASLAVGVLVLVCVLVVTLVVPTVVAGSGTMPGLSAREQPQEAGEEPTMNPLSTPPRALWEVTDTSTVGTSTSKYLTPYAADDRTIVVGAQPNPQSPGTVMAIDAQSGQAVWPEPSPFLADGCALSRDERLACVRSEDDTTEIAFIDPKTGKVSNTGTAELGRGRIVRAADGFLVMTRRYAGDDGAPSGSEFATNVLTWFDSAGQSRWTQQLPEEVDHTELSEAGNVIVAGNSTARARVFSLPTGEILYDSAERTGTGWPDQQTYIGVAATGTGFAVSYRDRQSRTLMLFNRQGIKTKEFPDLLIAGGHPVAGETALLPVEGEYKSDNAIFGVVSTEKGELLWSVDGRGAHDVGLLAGRYIGMRMLEGEGYRWGLFDAETGAPHPTIPMSTHQNYEAFDGTHLIFEGNRIGYEPGTEAVTGFDPATGREVWRLKKVGAGDDAEMLFVGPYLFVLDAQDGESRPTLTKLG